MNQDERQRLPEQEIGFRLRDTCTRLSLGSPALYIVYNGVRHIMADSVTYSSTIITRPIETTTTITVNDPAYFIGGDLSYGGLDE